MGSEMCIRDRGEAAGSQDFLDLVERLAAQVGSLEQLVFGALDKVCLLYTSDAADERSSVDLGGRRIIKKKKSSSLPWRREKSTNKYIKRNN